MKHRYRIVYDGQRYFIQKRMFGIWWYNKDGAGDRIYHYRLEHSREMLDRIIEPPAPKKKKEPLKVIEEITA